MSMTDNSAHRPRPLISVDHSSGIPYYRQIIDQILHAIAGHAIAPGDQLPTVRQLAVDLAVNPNTVSKAYNELLIRGVLIAQQGTGTFVSKKEVRISELQRRRKLNEVVQEMVAKASAFGLTVDELVEALAQVKEE